ncbi:MAG: YjdF family protein, partial [Clostridiales bacterium]
MEKTISKLTVFFEEPFWVGVFERETDGRYEVCKVTFGAEPKDYEVYDFMLKNYEKLHFSPSLEVGAVADKRINPKRMQREINRQ